LGISIDGIKYYMWHARNPDLGFGISILSRFNSCQAAEDYMAVKRLRKYLHQMKDQEILFQEQNLEYFPDPVC
jgi:hypothetical protein